MTSTAELVGGEYDGLVRVMYEDPPPSIVVLDAGFYTAKEGHFGWMRKQISYRHELTRKDEQGNDRVIYVLEQTDG